MFNRKQIPKMNYDTNLSSFHLSTIEKGYLLRFGTTNYLPLALDMLSSKELTGNITFIGKDEDAFKNIDVRQESPKSVISLIHLQLQYWDVFRFELLSENGRRIEYDMGDCFLNFADRDDIPPYLRRIFTDEGFAITVYSYLINNIDCTVIYDGKEFSVMPPINMDELDLPHSEESPF